MLIFFFVRKSIEWIKNQPGDRLKLLNEKKKLRGVSIKRETNL